MGVTTTTNSAATYVPIATTTLGSAAASYTFSSIPSTYTDLVLVAQTGSSVAGNLKITVGNGSVDTGTNYSLTYLYGNGTAASSGRVSNNTYIQGAGMNNNLNTNHICHFMNYANTNTYKTVLIRSGGADLEASAWVNLWRSTAAINIMTISDNSSGNLTAGSTFTLYGILGA